MKHSYKIDTEAQNSTESSLLLCVSVAIALLYILSSCTSTPEIDIPEEIRSLENLAVYDPQSEPLLDINLEQELVIGDSDDIIIGRMGGIAVDDDGNIFLADMDNQSLYMFRSDGSFARSIGRSGSGPGEFRSIIAPLIKDEFLYVFDRSQMRITAFSIKDYSYSHSLSLSGGNSPIAGFPNIYQPLSDGSYLILTNISHREPGNIGIEIGSFIVGSNSELIQKDIFDITEPDVFVLETGGNITWTSFSFHRRPLIRVSESEEFYYVISDRLLIKIFDTSGNLKRTIYYPYENVPLSRQVALSMIESELFRNEARNRDLPETLPVLSAMVVDDKDRIWIQLMNHDDKPRDWWLLNSEGEKKAKFTLPEKYVLQLVKNDYAYFRETDEETGLQTIVKYRVDLL